MTREENILWHLEMGMSHEIAPGEILYLLARNDELQREKEKMQAVVDAAKAASYEYFHPATGDGDIINKMHWLRNVISDSTPRGGTM